MRYFPISLLIGVLFAALASCGAIEEHDRGMLGQPSRAVAMYAAQVQFAHDVCEGHVNASESARFVTMSGRNGLSLTHYQRNFPEFVGYLNEASRKYGASWGNLTPVEREQFCQGYSSDVEGFRTLQVVQNSINFQRYFSPPSDEFLRSAEQRAVVGGSVLGAAALVSAAGGVSDVRSGNYTRAQQRFSRTSAAGEVMSNAATISEVNFCSFYQPFMGANAPIGAAVWRTYHSIQKC